MDGAHPTPETQPKAKPAAINRVLKDSSLYLLGNLAGRVVGFLAIPFYARFLSPAQYGIIELVELSTQTVAIAFGLQALGTALSRLFHDQTSLEAERAVVSTSLIATAMLSAFVTIAVVAGAGPLSQLLFHSDQWTTLLQAAFVAMFFSNMIELVLVYERIRNNVRFYLAYSLITLAVSLALNIVFIGVLGAGVWGFLASKLVVSTTSCVFMAIRMNRDVGWRWQAVYVPELVRFGAPLVVSSLSYFAIHFSDRFFLSGTVSLAELGRYALAYRFAFLVSAVVGDSFSKSWNVTLYRYLDRPTWPQQFARIASYLTLILFLTGLGIALFSAELLRIMVPPEFYPPPFLLPILIASYLAREVGDFFRSLMLINKRSGLVGRIALASAVLNLVANAILIPRYGIDGAAWATLLTWSAYLVVCWVVAVREHRLPIRPAAYVRITVLLVAVFGASEWIRVDSFLPQIMMDTLWLVLFGTAAFVWFFSASERRGAIGLAGSMALWPLGRGLVPPGSWPCDNPPLLLLAPSKLAPDLRRLGLDVTLVDLVPATGDRPSAWPARAMTLALAGIERLLPAADRVSVFPHAFMAAAASVQTGGVVLSATDQAVSHLVATAIRHRYRIGWIADLRGPLPTGLLTRLALENADAILAESDAAATSFRTRHPACATRLHVLARDEPDEAPQLIRIIETVRPVQT